MAHWQICLDSLLARGTTKIQDLFWSTGNDFSTLFAPLIRDGRMEKFYWEPNGEELVDIIFAMYKDDGLMRQDIWELYKAFPNQCESITGLSMSWIAVIAVCWSIMSTFFIDYTTLWTERSPFRHVRIMPPNCTLSVLALSNALAICCLGDTWDTPQGNCIRLWKWHGLFGLWKFVLIACFAHRIWLNRLVCCVC